MANRGNQYHSVPPQQLSMEDKEFIKLIEDGMKKAPAFREAYPEHPAVKRWHASEDAEERRRQAGLIVDAAKNKLRANYMQGAIQTYHDSMEKFSKLGLDVAIDLLENGRSEKVRADLAIEAIRHKVGTPVQKVAVQEQKTVTITFGRPINEPIEGEVVSQSSSERRDPDETSDI